MALIGELIAVWRNKDTVFHAGKELSNAATWKKRTLVVNAIVALLSGTSAVAAAAGYSIEIDEQTLQVFGEGVFAAFTIANSVIHVVTSSKVGL